MATPLTFTLFALAVSLMVGALPATAADLDRGAQIYAECAGCHDLRENKMGPRHCWLMERPAGKVPGFTYSGAMESSGLVWDEKTLDEFLTMPLSFLSGTNMGYAGLFDEKDRADLIGYLKNLTNDAEACDGIDNLR